MDVKIYNTSVNAAADTTVSIAMADNKQYIIATGSGELFDALFGETDENNKYCPLSHENAAVLRKFFPYCAPKPLVPQNGIISLGDRLGLATPYHAQIVESFNITPFFALHSPRETALTGRTFQNAVDDATFGTFRVKFDREWGAEGINLVTMEDVEAAAAAACGMLTVECSDAAENIEFICEVYERFCKEGNAHCLSLTMSGHEKVTDAALQAEITAKLKEKGVKFFSFTPYLGDELQGLSDCPDAVQIIEERLAEHISTAEGSYRIGIENIDYKYSLLPLIARMGNGRFFVRTSCASWLCGARAIAKNEPKFFRELVRGAADITRKKDDLSVNVYSVSDEELPQVLDNTEIREILHDALGTLLRRRDDKGAIMFRDRIFESLAMYEADYGANIISTVGRHIASLDTNK